MQRIDIYFLEMDINITAHETIVQFKKSHITNIMEIPHVTVSDSIIPLPSSNNSKPEFGLYHSFAFLCTFFILFIIYLYMPKCIFFCMFLNLYKYYQNIYYPFLSKMLMMVISIEIESSSSLIFNFYRYE